jgi:polysaccharide transporter, PST family
MEQIKQFLFFNLTNKQTFIKNTFWLFVGEFGIRALKIIIFIYAVRKLGATEWGLFSYALAIMSIFNIFSDIGINSVLTKKASSSNDEKQNYISTSFFLKLILTIISSLALLSLVFFIKDDNTVKFLIPITTVLFFFDTLKNFGFALNQAFERMEVEAITKIISASILILLGFIFVKIKPTASYLLYSYVISSFIGLVIIYLNLRKYFKNLILNIKKDLLIPIWKEAWPIGVAGALGTVLASIDMVILGWFTTPDQIGFYSTAQKPVQALYIIPSIIGIAILPAFSRFAISDIEKMKKTTKKLIKFSFLFTIPIVIGCFLLGDFAFNLIFGQEYQNSILIFKIMTLIIITGAPSSIISKAIFASGNQKKLIQFILISIIINIILCLLTIPRFGILGAAISVTVSQTIGNLFLIFKYRNILK